ncbi:nuclear transport factor 2 family protein [Marinobacterium lutimaris]|uniref:SnoaL-like domain-containing protein n=1 Tax=Marinobacterium lutimaris TaxID=568106 RepID=A0A1H5X9Q4_9GAMM|nr:nuclear transport factor 2 family protein [Marinobacterium lutimaris]SEG08478.1 SnoaL-like domain-containing protein [Marinobacterium lutimaris]
MMSISADRQALGERVDQLGQAWLDGTTDRLGELFTSDARLISSQHGEYQGAQAIIAALAEDTAEAPFQGAMTNRYLAVEPGSDQAAASVYLFGLTQRMGRAAFIFGAALVMRFERVEGRWLFSEVRLQINWTNGDNRLVPHWSKPPGTNGWQMGDEAPVLVSELHSPWAIMPKAAVPESLDEALHELYARYSFGVDQNDMGLLISAYDDDISGGFAPVGNLSGRDTVIGVLKSFRHLATLWQHFAEVVRIEDEGDGQHVKLIVARIIPERPMDEQGNRIYGAHYQLRARRQPDGQWKFCWTDYRPGWFSEHQIPAFDVGNATA